MAVQNRKESTVFRSQTREEILPLDNDSKKVLERLILPRICGVVKALGILPTKEEKEHGKGAKDVYGRV